MSLSLLLLFKPQLAFSARGARCLRGGIWVSHEYYEKVLFSRLGALPFMTIHEDNSAWSFNDGQFVLESYFTLEGSNDGSYYVNASDGEVQSNYRVRRRRNGTTVLIFSSVTVDRLISTSSVDEFTAAPVTQENIHSVDEDSLPFNCRRNTLILRVASPSGGFTRVRFTRD